MGNLFKKKVAMNKYLKPLCIFLFLPFITFAQIAEEIFYNNDELAKITWYDGNSQKDSLKTYYRSGKLNEVFYFNNQEEFHGIAYKYNKLGEKLTTWLFQNGKLIRRVDHKLEFNKKNVKKVTSTINRLKSINKYLDSNNSSDLLLYAQAHARYMLFNSTLALDGFEKLNKKIEKNTLKFDHKKKANIYDCLGSLYANYDMKDHAVHFKLEAIATSPEQSRLYNNIGSYLTRIKSYRLGISYLNKALNFSKKHSFANWALSATYTDLEEYEKAMKCVNISFENEASLYKYGTGNAERNIQTIRGWLHHKLGDSQKGITDLENALKINKNNSFALRNLGVIYHDLGQFDKACELLQKSKDLHYEKTFDRDDLQVYLDASCSNQKNTKKVFSIRTLPYIYPNPVKNSTRLENIDITNFNYEIYDYGGNFITTGISKGKNIDVSSLAEGLYILKIQNSKTSIELKLVKI